MELLYGSAVFHSVQSFAFRHLTLLMIAALSVYLIRFYETLELQPSWRTYIDPELYHNGRYPDRKTERLPRPVVTDLDSDDSAEIVVVTNTLHLEVLMAIESSSSSPSKALPLLHTIRSTSILSPVGGASSVPVAIATGHLQPANGTTLPKKVIVVILANWSVLCYDHTLTLLWHQSNWSDDWTGQKIVYAAIQLTTVSVDRRDVGTVIVAASYRESRDSGRDQQTGESKRSSDSAGERRKLAVFALGGASGDIRWMHRVNERKQREAKQERPSLQHWKLSIQPVEVGEFDWSEYSEIILNQMRHRSHKHGDSRVSLVSLKQEDMLAVHNSPLNQWLHAHTQTAVAPPVADGIILVDRHGVMLFGLHSGISLCRLHFPTSSLSVYADLDGDGRLDTVQADITSCTGSAVNTHGEQRSLWQVPICAGATWWTWLTSATRNDKEDSRLALPPVVVQRVSRSGQLARHLLAISDIEQNLYDSVFVTSDGIVTSYGHAGQLNWQVQVPADWIAAADDDAQSELYDFYKHAFKPSMVVMETGVDGKQRNVLVSGWSQMALVDVENGRLLASHSLPCHPITTPVTADLNGDGLTDVIVHCPEGFVIFALRRHNNYVYTAFVAVFVIVVIALTYSCKMAT